MVLKVEVFLSSIDWFDFLAEVVLKTMVVCLLRIGEALPTKLLPMKLSHGDIRFVYQNGKLFEVDIRICPLKKSVRAQKAGQKSDGGAPLRGTNGCARRGRATRLGRVIHCPSVASTIIPRIILVDSGTLRPMVQVPKLEDKSTLETQMAI